MRVLHVARECAPLAKAGGLGDVVGALPQATVRGGGVECSVLLPAYDPLRPLLGETVAAGHVRVGSERLAYRVRRAGTDPKGPFARVPVLLVEQECFAGPSPYGGDELRREVVLSAAALQAGAAHDVVHVHDHHAALALIGLAGHPAPRPAVLTVHNAHYHGVLPWSAIEQLDLPPALDRGRCDHADAFNRLKASVLHAGIVSTVSPSHAGDLLESPDASAGLDYAFRSLGDRFVGILNGIDLDAWNPETDPLLDARYSRRDLSGKQEQKRALCRQAGLDAAAPLLAFVGRLVPDKGIDALLSGLPIVLERHPTAQALLLGTGEARYEEALVALQARHAPRISVAMLHDERFAHRLYASADILLMPSWYEPCGLSQMYALRYGTVPVVFPTGGLRDTIEPFDPAGGPERSRGNGAWMATSDGPGLAEAALRALSWMEDPATWSRLRDAGMTADHGWSASAARHVATYRRAMGAA